MAIRKWTEQERNIVERLYPEHSNEYIAEMVHRTTSSIKNYAQKYNLHKNAAFAEEQRKKNQFKPGHRPKNKGVPMKYWMSPEGIERSSRTRWHGRHDKPVGYERTDREGYVYIKIEKTKKMVLKHRWVWECANGSVPPGHNIQFKDGNRSNCSLDNLYCISRAEQMVKNNKSIGEERHKRRCEKIQESRNMRIRADRARICFGLEPKSKLIKHYKSQKRKAI